MADPKTGMEKADMKRLLAVSKKEPVNCAVGQGKEPAFALVMLDKIKSPKGIEAALLKEFPDSKNRGYGTAVVDTDEDPKLVKFTLNKAPSGMARKIAKTLKGTGFSKVIIVDETGAPLDSAGEEEEAEQAAPAAAAPPPPPPPPGPAPQPAAAAPDAATLERALAQMVPGIPAAAAGRPDVQKQLVTLAQQAQAAIKGGDLAAAGAAISGLRGAIAGAAPAAAGSAPTDTQGTAGAVAFGKSRLAWLAARQKVISEIDKLQAVILTTYKDDGIGDQLTKSYKQTVQPVIDGFDTELADKLDAAVNATDPGARGALVGEAKALIGRYQKFLDGETLIADLDDNPFVPLSIHATVSATLAALAKTVR